MRRANLAFALVFALFAMAVTVSGATFPPNIYFTQAPFSPVSIGDGPSGVTVGDFNADGIPDLAYANGSGNSAGVLLGNGNGVFHSGPNSPRATDASLTMGVAVGDFNNDGHLDVVATDIPGGLGGLWNAITGSIGGNVSVFLGDGAGNLGSHIDSDAKGDFPIALAAGDFNQDGKQDVAVANLNSDNISILLGSGDGEFSLSSHVAVGHRPTSVAVGDFNLDGKVDLAVTNAADDTVSILLGSGDGSFSNSLNTSVHSRPISAAVGDFNGDGRPDLAVAGQLSSNVSVLLGNGAGSFTSNTRFGVARQPSAIVVGDFNNDGKQDVAVANRMSDMVSVLLGTGDGIFSRFRNTAVQDQPIALVAGRFDADGKLDLAVVNSAGDSISVLLNDTDLTPPTLTMPNLAASYVYNSSLTLTFGAEDTESGVSTIEATLNGAPVSNNQTVLLDHPGTNTFILTATDKVGNTATRSASFAVLYNFTGYLPPVPNDGSGLFKLRSVIPLRFQLSDAHDAPVPTAVAVLSVQKISNGTLSGTPIDATEPGNTDSGNLFQYHSGANVYAYELATTPLSRGTWQIQAHLDDGSVHTVVVGLK
jgi:VCBS repeat protein